TTNSQEAPMSSDAAEPIEIVEAFLAAFEAMDFDTALTLLADDVEYTNIPMGTVHGHAGVREVLGPFFAPIHENEFIVHRRAADGPVVFLERLDRHRLDHGWRELPVNSVFEVHDGKVTVWRDYFDLLTAGKIHDAGAA
ncbi:MAG: limonene-1,2-epoxide hydrolase family protein, partial [Ilumatobacteraceae bacterium]